MVTFHWKRIHIGGKAKKPLSEATSTAKQSYHVAKVGIANYSQSFVRFLEKVLESGF